MQFNSHATNQDLYSDALDRTGADSDAFTINMFTRWANQYYDDIHLSIMLAKGAWIYDDINYTGLPIATDTITSGQQDYQLDETHWRIHNILVKTDSGEWTTLTQIDPRSDEAMHLLEDDSTTSTPNKYWIIRRSLFLHPIPNYTQAASLKIYYQRGASYFAADDTTKTPGIAQAHHDYISKGAAYEYSIGRLSDLEQELRNHLPRRKAEIVKFEGKTNKDKATKMTTKYRSAK